MAQHLNFPLSRRQPYHDDFRQPLDTGVTELKFNTTSTSTSFLVWVETTSSIFVSVKWIYGSWMITGFRIRQDPRKTSFQYQNDLRKTCHCQIWVSHDRGHRLVNWFLINYKSISVLAYALQYTWSAELIRCWAVRRLSVRPSENLFLNRIGPLSFHAICPIFGLNVHTKIAQKVMEGYFCCFALHFSMDLELQK